MQERENFAHTKSGLKQFYERLPDIVVKTLPNHYLEQLFIASQVSELNLRAPGKYWKRTTSLNVLSNFNPLSRIFHFIPSSGSGAYPALEVAYHWGRAVDDVVDGDAPVPTKNLSVEDWIESLKDCAREGGRNVPKGISVEFMQKRTLMRLERMGSGVNIREEMLNFLDAMKHEHNRRVNKLVLSRQELEELNKNSFGPPHTITLAAVRSKAQAEDVRELGQIQGRIQALRDIHVELERGICNIPQETLEESKVTFLELGENPQLFDTNSSLLRWKSDEIRKCGVLMNQLRLRQLDRPASLYTNYFLHETEQYIAKL